MKLMVATKKIVPILVASVFVGGVLFAPYRKLQGAPTLILDLNFNASTAHSTTKPQFDAINATLPSGQSGDIPIQYEGGTVADRYARVISDPTTTGTMWVGSSVRRTPSRLNTAWSDSTR